MSRSSKKTLLHPYVTYIEHRLEKLLGAVDVEVDGQAVPVTGFRLKNLPAWRLERSSKLLGNLGPLSGYCNAKCKFCYETGNPLRYERALIDLAEVETRIRHFDPQTGVGLIQPRSRLYLEPFVHPRLLEILRRVRARSPNEIMSLTTNGSALTAEMVTALSELKPLTLVVSINHCRVRARRELMGLCSAGTGLKALSRLRDHGIPFVGSIVAWYTTPVGELVETARFIDGFEPRGIRVTLPGFSRYFSEERLFDTRSTWSEITAALEAIRPELSAPLVVMPHLFSSLPLIPTIDGVIRNSPADLAGLRPGDLMVQLDDASILTKQHAKALLTEPQKRREVRRLTIQRGGEALTVCLQEPTDPALDLYPYKPRGYRAVVDERDDTVGLSFGIFLTHDFELSSIRRLIRIIEAHRATRVLMLSSQIIAPIAESVINAIPEFKAFFSDIEFHLRVPPHDFWGGNILLGDLYMVSDYLAAARAFIAEQGARPELVVLPSSFATELGFDLGGASYQELERRLGIPVELVPCRQIMI